MPTCISTVIERAGGICFEPVELVPSYNVLGSVFGFMHSAISRYNAKCFLTEALISELFL